MRRGELLWTSKGMEKERLDEMNPKRYLFQALGFEGPNGFKVLNGFQ